MIEVKFIDGTPVSDDYLTPASLLVRDAAMAIEMFGDNELEAAARADAWRCARETAAQCKRCCVCSKEIFDEESSAFGACEDCLDGVHCNPDMFIQQTLLEGEYGRPVAQRESEAGLAPIFRDAEAQRSYRKIVDPSGFGFDRMTRSPRRNVAARVRLGTRGSGCCHRRRYCDEVEVGCPPRTTGMAAPHPVSQRQRVAADAGQRATRCAGRRTGGGQQRRLLPDQWRVHRAAQQAPDCEGRQGRTRAGAISLRAARGSKGCFGTDRHCAAQPPRRLGAASTAKRAVMVVTPLCSAYARKSVRQSSRLEA